MPTSLDRHQPQSRSHAHALPFADAVPGFYRYADGCRVHKHADGTCTLLPYTDTEPLDPHTELDFATHPDG